MKRKEKSSLSKQRIIDAALEEFSNYGYSDASLSRVCRKKDISKGMIYHYFKSKDELYLLCVDICFKDLTEYLKTNLIINSQDIEGMLKKYFDIRLDFFTKNPLYLGIISDLLLNTPEHLKTEILEIRRDFDEVNISLLMAMLNAANLRKGLTADIIANDFKIYMSYLNFTFKDVLEKKASREQALEEHERMIYRQIEMMLYGILESEDSHGKSEHID